MSVMITRLTTVLFPPILTGSFSECCVKRFLHISIGSLDTEIIYAGGMTGRCPEDDKIVMKRGGAKCVEKEVKGGRSVTGCVEVK
jgi:hypothetical protein